jgi:hypothetical protein
MPFIHEFTDGDYPVKLEQHSNGRFKVTYGAEIHDNLVYEDAAREYGYCVFHSLACAGKIEHSES